MTSRVKNTVFLVAGILIFLAVFLVFSVLYLQRTNIRDVNQIKTHATIIADDIWNLSTSGTKAYLQLALNAGHYKVLTVTLEDGSIFHQEVSPLLTGMDKLLHQLNFMGTKELSSEIMYDGQKIGSLHGEKYMRAFYSLFNIFSLQLFVVLIVAFILYLSSNRRILEQKVQERTREFMESEGRFQELVNLLPEMVLETDFHGKITYANERALERFGISIREGSDSTCFDLIILEQKKGENKKFISWAQRQKHELNEYTARSADGSTFPILIRCALIYKDKQITGARVLIIDITERNAFEEQLRRDQKMKTIGMMAGGVAHDLNNILSGLINYPELLLLKLPNDSELRKDVVSMKKAGLRAAEVVADLLTVARGIAATRRVASLNDLILEYLDSPEFLKLQSLYPDFSCKTELDYTICNISCSIIHVRKCLMNLITNAIEAMDGSGQVIITTASHQIDEPHPQNSSIGQESYTLLSIHDSGPGVSAGDMKHIFEPFYSKKNMGRSGTGLGLSVVWNTMQDHGGGVEVKGDESGTTFMLNFPCVTDDVEHVGDETKWEFFSGKGETILVVDDEPQQRDIAVQLLRSLGYQPNAVSDGEEAIEYLKNNSVDLLVLDMILGPGLNGRQTYERILLSKPNQKAVIVSGYSESDDVKATLELGAGSLISKPYIKEQFAKVVQTELSRQVKLKSPA